MFNRGTRIALRYAIYRTHLLEKHVNALYSIMKSKLPEEAEYLEDLLGDWQEEVSKMHAAFLGGDDGYFNDYEVSFPD